MSYVQDQSKGKPRIDSLQALRAWAFLGIFLRHTGVFSGWPTLGVSVFFVLSGFLMEYRYDDKELKASVPDNLRFSIQKIKKLYPLHIITMICAVLIYLAVRVPKGMSRKAVTNLAYNIARNVTLLQSWVPDSNVNTALNGVAWYLSVTLFLYFMFPWLKKVIGKLSTAGLYIACAAVLILQVAACIPVIKVYGEASPVYTWFMYCNPVFRLGDFFIGCALKHMFFESNMRSMKPAKATVLEIAAIAVTVPVYSWLNRLDSTSLLQLALRNWTTGFIVLAVIWVTLFAANRGLVTRLLSNRVTKFIGDISAYAFLIHLVLIQAIVNWMTYKNITLTVGGNYLLIVIEFAVTIALSVLYRNIHEKRLRKDKAAKTA